MSVVGEVDVGMNLRTIFAAWERSETTPPALCEPVLRPPIERTPATTNDHLLVVSWKKSGLRGGDGPAAAGRRK